MRADIKMAVKSAERAAETASQAKEATAALKADAEKLKKETVPNEIVEKAVEKMMESRWPSWSQPGRPSSKASEGSKGDGSKGGGGKGGGKSAVALEQASRTITFGQFPEGTLSTTIVDFIRATVGEQVTKEADEIFAYGKKYAERGAVRFKTSGAMWKHMEDHAGNHRHDYGDGHVYVNPHNDGRIGEDLDKSKAANRMTRAIIEHVGGNPKEVKTDIQANHGTGTVKYQGKRVLEWKDGAMQVVEDGDGKAFAVPFRALMARAQT